MKVTVRTLNSFREKPKKIEKILQSWKQENRAYSLRFSNDRSSGMQMLIFYLEGLDKNQVAEMNAELETVGFDRFGRLSYDAISVEKEITDD